MRALPLRAASRGRPGGQTEAHRALAATWRAFGLIAVFSLVINLLNLASPLHMMQVYNRVLPTGGIETLLLLTGITALALLLLAALDAVRNSVAVRVGCWLNDRLGPLVLETGIRARLMGDNAGAQPLRDLATIQNFVASQGLAVFFDAPWVPIFVILIWALHPALGLMALVAALILVGLSVANEFMTRKQTLTATLAQNSATQQADAFIRNAEVVRAMGMLPAMTERWQRVNDRALAALQDAGERGGILLGATKFVRFFVQVAILGMGAALVIKGELSPGGMIAASILLGRALAPVEQAMGAWRSFTTARIAFNRIVHRLKTFPPEPERIRLPDPVGRLRVEKVSYAPPGSKEAILENISFSVEPGEAVAVIGPSAGGKSSLCRMLVGVAQPTSGEVRIDGAELGHWNASELGGFIGYLPQDVELFAGTVRENISRMQNTEDDDAIVRAASLAHAHDLILRLPESYETQIGDGGTRLSGGQRQRIGLARAVYGNPRLIVLDEPNANLDQAGEAALAAAIAELKSEGAAIVIVGHRPSTIAEADKILLLRDGRVELFGPRDTVLAELRRTANAKQSQVQRPAEADEARLPPHHQPQLQPQPIASA